VGLGADCATNQAAGSFSGMFDTGADLICNENNYCAYDALRTCCLDDYQGTEPFEAPEARLVRHLVLNAPVVAVVDVHNFVAEMGRTTKTAPVGFGDAGGHDADNIEEIRNRAADLSTTAGQTYWQSHAAIGTVLPSFFDYGTGGRGSGMGQIPSWTARTPTSAGAVLAGIDNYDDETYRGINAFNIELPPWSLNEFDPTIPADVPLIADWGEHMSCDSTTPVGTDGRAPMSRMTVAVANAGFLAAARYLIAQAATPLIGSDELGAPFAARADTGVVGLLVHDGGRRGVIHGEMDNTVYVPAGRWAVTGDVLYQNTNSPAWDTNYTVKTSVSPLGVFPWGTVHARSRVFDSASLYGMSPPGDLSSYEMRADFKPGIDYQVKAELTAAAHDDTLVNDIRVTKVRGLGCATGALPESTEHAGSMTSDEFCEDRIVADVQRFFCNEDRDRCQECGYDPSGPEIQLVAPCSTWYGNGAFCMAGMCDTPDVCWSASFEDDFEGAEPVVVNGVNNASTSWVATLHQDGSPMAEPPRDTDEIRFQTPTLPDIIFSNMLVVEVETLCAEIPAAPDGGFEAMAHLGTLPLFPPGNLLFPWTEPAAGDSVVSLEVTLNDAQLATFKGGTPITVQLRSVTDPSTDEYPSLVYRVSLGFYAEGSEHPDFYDELERLIVPPWEPVMVKELSGEANATMLVPDQGQVTMGNELVYRPTSGVGAASVRVAVANVRGEQVGEVTQNDAGILVHLSSLDAREGPFTVYLQSTRLPLDGMVYHCPANTPDCLQLDLSRDACGGFSCGADEVCCRGEQDVVCADVAVDTDNCGACGHRCGANETCLDGVCAIVTSLDCEGTQCPGGLACCEDPNGLPACVNAKSDAANCGWCDHVCAANKRCEFGLCVPRWGEKCGTACTGGKTCCYGALGGNQCVDTAGSQLHCGKCGNICGFGETCSEGKCVPWLSIYDPCWGDRTNCGAPYWIDCRDLQSDVESCGFCDVRCASGAECVSGHCLMEEYLFSEAADE
jgi:hypothetical protein